MSLDVSLEFDEPICRESSGIFIRENGAMREISRAEWDERCPGHTPVVAEQKTETRDVYSRNITHNLGEMAEAAGIYKHLWRPEEVGVSKAAELIDPLTTGLARLRDKPAKFRQLNSSNGWGDYDGLLAFVTDYLEACREHPTATIRVSR